MKTTTYRIVGILLVALLAVAFGCQGTGGEPDTEGTTAPGSSAPVSEADAGRAEVLFRENDCGLCHGEDRAGTDMGPPLRDLDRFWTVDRLVVYLEDPLAFHETEPEFLARRQQFEMEMPPFDHLPEADRRSLATWLLAE